MDSQRSSPDWKCYREQTIRFNLNTDKNVWIIFGQNGYGKTSLLEAILWCLYGNEGVSTKDLPEYFHRGTAKKKVELELAVQLNFEDKGKYYYISRTAQRKLRGKTSYAEIAEPTFNQDGKEIKDPREYIESLLPKSCKDFFFFDGEEIQRYAQLTQTDETREAIERILGIPELKNLREDAEKALQQLEKDLNKASATNQTLKGKTDQLAKLQEEIEITTGQLQKAKQDLTNAIRIQEDCQERARQIDDLRGLLEELTRREPEKQRLQEKLENAQKEVENALKQASVPLLLEFVQEVYDDLQRKSIQTNRLSVSLTQLQDILNADACLCGRCLDESSREYIRQQLQQLENAGNGTKEAIALNELQTQLARLLRYPTLDFDGLLLKRDRFQEDLDDITQNISRLKRDTEGVNQAEAAEIWRKVGVAERDVEIKGEQIKRLSREIEQRRQESDRLRQEIKTLAGGNQETATLVKQVKLAEGLRNAANELIAWYIGDRRQTIESQTSQLHRQVTNKPDEYQGVVITDKYTLGVKTVTQEVLNPEILSAGEKEALAFAFITGLNLASETAAPLIMDTPFGHLDTQHQKNIVNSLGTLPSQVIVLATDRDFPDYLLRKLRPHVAEIHNIQRNAIADASIVEMDE